MHMACSASQWVLTVGYMDLWEGEAEQSVFNSVHCSSVIRSKFFSQKPCLLSVYANAI